MKPDRTTWPLINWLRMSERRRCVAPWRLRSVVAVCVGSGAASLSCLRRMGPSFVILDLARRGVARLDFGGP